MQLHLNPFILNESMQSPRLTTQKEHFKRKINYIGVAPMGFVGLILIGFPSGLFTKLERFVHLIRLFYL